MDHKHHIIAIFAVVCGLLFLVLSSTSLGMKLARSKWLNSTCSVINSTVYSIPICYDLSSCEDHYTLLWWVEYYNSIAQRNIEDEMQYLSTNEGKVNALEQTFITGRNYTCYFRSYDFEVQWNIPYENWRSIGIAGIIFGIWTFCFSVMTFVFYDRCIKMTYVNNI